MSERATLDELLDFANKVREAGGGNPLTALIPAVPEDSSQCLIAKNLNFNCRVDSMGASNEFDKTQLWGMYLEDEGTRDAIADALDLSTFEQPSDNGEEYGVVLPKRIGQVANDFDEITGEVCRYIDDEHGVDEDMPEHAKDDIRELWPYIAESVRETYAIAGIVNADGSVVL
jgi:hypothetical protein